MAKSKRGFASMSPARREQIASMGGKAAHEHGTAHTWTSEEARIAGRKGGLATKGKRTPSGDDTEEQIANTGALR